MAIKKVELSARNVRGIKNKGRYSAGGVPGLMLQVSSTLSKSWILRVTIAKKRRDIGLGGFPEVSLAIAREKAKEMRQCVKNGEDPLITKNNNKQALIKAQLQQVTFAKVANECYQVKKQEFSNERHIKQWIGTLEKYAFPIIGELYINDIEPHHITKILKPIWATKTETATRLRQRITLVFDYAVASGARTKSNPAHWEGCLKLLLPSPAILKEQQGKDDNHHPALPYPMQQEFMKSLAEEHVMSAYALRFSIFCAMRSSEVRFLTWSEIDLEKKTILIPKERMKGKKRKHEIPLSPLAIAALEHVKAIYEKTSNKSPYVFQNTRNNPLSDATIGKLIRTMNGKRIKSNQSLFIDPEQGNKVATPHGFRSTFKDWARENTRYSDESSELALAHVSTDATRRAYARAALIPERRKLMRDWSEFCIGEKEPKDD